MTEMVSEIMSFITMINVAFVVKVSIIMKIKKSS